MTRHKILKYLPLAVALSGIAALAMDTVGNPDSMAKHVGIDSVIVAFGALLILAAMRRYGQFKLNQRAYLSILMVVFAGSFVLLNILSIWDYSSPLNYVYSKTRVQIPNLGNMSLFSLAYLFMGMKWTWVRKHYRKVIFLLPIGFLYYLAIVRLWPMKFFFEIVKEDQVIEYMQFWVLVAGGLAILKLFQANYKKLKLPAKAVILLLALGLLFIAGDEISWGQRLLGVATPERLTELNRQNEITLHNFYSIEWLVEVVYAWIGLIGGVAWVIKARVSKLNRFLGSLIPDSSLMFYFIIPGIYYLYPFYTVVNRIPEWSEVMELLFYAGVSLHLYQFSRDLAARAKA